MHSQGRALTIHDGPGAEEDMVSYELLLALAIFVARVCVLSASCFAKRALRAVGGAFLIFPVPPSRHPSSRPPLGGLASGCYDFERWVLA